MWGNKSASTLKENVLKSELQLKIMLSDMTCCKIFFFPFLEKLVISSSANCTLRCWVVTSTLKVPFTKAHLLNVDVFYSPYHKLSPSGPPHRARGTRAPMWMPPKLKQMLRCVHCQLNCSSGSLCLFLKHVANVATGTIADHFNYCVTQLCKCGIYRLLQLFDWTHGLKPPLYLSYVQNNSLSFKQLDLPLKILFL